MGKCKEVGEFVVSEAHEEGVAMATPHDAEVESAIKRKVSVCYSTSLVQRRIRRRVIGETEKTKVKEASSSNDPCDSCCSSQGSTDLHKETSEFSDLEVQQLQEEIDDASTWTYGLHSCRKSTETEPIGDAVAESFELLATAKPPLDENSSSLSNELVEMPPSNAELEEFFSVAEKDLMRQFADKYNFDFVKEEPLAGSYDWVRVQP